MSIRNLDQMFRPRSVAVIGASKRPHSVGATVMKNLLMGGFDGPIMPVNPNYRAIGGILAYPSVVALPHAPDLAIICTPAPTVSGLISELGERGTRAAVVLSAGLDGVSPETGKTFQQGMLDAARPYLLRILGPNCVGLIMPGTAIWAASGRCNP